MDIDDDHRISRRRLAVEKQTAHYVFDLITSASLLVSLFCLLWPTWLLILLHYGVSGDSVQIVTGYWVVMTYANVAAVTLEWLALWASGWNKSGSLIKTLLLLMALLLAGSPIYLSFVFPVLYTQREVVFFTVQNCSSISHA